MRKYFPVNLIQPIMLLGKKENNKDNVRKNPICYITAILIIHIEKNSVIMVIKIIEMKLVKRREV